MKRIVSLILAMVLSLATCLTAFADEPTQEELLAQYYAALEKQQTNGNSNIKNGINYNNKVFIMMNKTLGKGKYQCTVCELIVFKPSDIKSGNIGKKIRTLAGKEYTLVNVKDVFKSKNEKYDVRYLKEREFNTQFGVKDSTGRYCFLGNDKDGITAYDAWECCIAWEEHYVVEKLTLSPNAVVNLRDWAFDFITNDNVHLFTGKDFMNIKENAQSIVLRGIKYYPLPNWWAKAKIENNVITEMDLVFSGQ